MTNVQIAELLRDVAAAYQLKDEAGAKFKIIAYQRAADAVEHASSELKDLWDEGKLEDVPGIGKSIAEHLGELFETGKSKHFDEVMKDLPPAMFKLMEVPGIGAKTAYKITNQFKSKFKTGDPLKTLDELAKAGEIAKIEGFGQQSQASIEKSIKEAKDRTVRTLLPYAQNIADEIISWLKVDKNIVRADVLGSLRRKSATVGDIDLAVATKNPEATIEHFSKYKKASRVLEKGTRTAAIIIPGGKQVDLMVESPESYGSLLQHFTGSKHHNIALREYALKHDLSLSDYGIYEKVKGKKVLKKIPTEEEFYKFIGMDWISPELREDTGEIEAALKHQLPNLIKLSDVKADLQIHSSFDIETSHDLGETSMVDVVDKASSLDYEYIAFTEHNPSRSKHSDAQIVDILKRKSEAVMKLNRSLSSKSTRGVKKVFNSLEIDIMPDGKLPVPEEGMNTLDFALVSIHSTFRLPKDEMTKRVLLALGHPKARIFAHPTARKLNEREGVDLDWDGIFSFCLKNNKWIEINCDPMRLDLPDNLVHEAVKKGVKLTLGTDAHHKEGLNNMRYGINVARRGWAEKSDIVNCLSLNEFENALF